MEPTRRELLLSAAALGALAGLDAGQEAPAVAPWFRSSLAEWSLHRELFAGELDPRDFAPLARKEWGLAAVEHVNTFFKAKAEDAAYLAELKRRADDGGVRSLLIMCDGEGALADPDGAARKRAVANHRKWLEAARALGCHAIRVNAAGEGEREEQAKRAAESLRALAELAAPLELSVLVENHGGLSSDGAWLAGVMRRADHPRVGTLPDFGNFDLGGGARYDRYQGVRELMPFAKAVSAKSHAFDAAGEETGTDYRRMLAIVREAGYRGWIGIEYEGAELPEREGIARTLRLLERARAATS